MPKSQLVLLIIFLGAAKFADTTLLAPPSISGATSYSVYQNATIQCVVSSTVPGTVTVDWSTTALSANISHQTINIISIVIEILVLTNVDSGYCGVYTCTATDADMIPMSASFDLSIAPIIKTPPANKVYILSPSLRVSFTCTVDGGVNNSVEILWSGPLDLPDARLMEVSSGVFTSNLTLTNLTTNFSGIYKCTTGYNNSLCTTNSSSNASLALLGPPTLTHQTESPLRVNCGNNNATLNFEFSGLPSLSHNDVQYKCIEPRGDNIETNDNFTVGITLDRIDNETELQILRLNINIVYINHARGGMYSCTASNSAGNTTATVLLQVLQSERSVFWFQIRLTAISNCNDWIREDMDLKLQDLKQQASNEISAGCDRCDESVISITEGVFRCFPGSESAVTYRALLHENCKISSIELQKPIERWLSSGRAIVVRSLVLKADSSCPVIVRHVNDPECAAGDPNSGMTSNGISDSIIVGGVSGALLGIVLLVGTMITVTIIATFKHRQTMAKLMGSEASRGLETVQQHIHASYNQQSQPESALASAPENTDGGDPVVYEDCSFYQLSPCPAYESVPHTTSNQ